MQSRDNSRPENEVASTSGKSEPRRVSPRRRNAFALIALLAVISASNALRRDWATVVAKYLPETVANASTHNIRPTGYEGMFELLKRLGKHPEHWQRSYRELNAPGALVMVAPSNPAQDFEIDQILSWVSKGNDLVYMDYFALSTGKGLLRKMSCKAFDSVSVTNKDIVPEKSTLTDHVVKVNLSAEARLDTETEGAASVIAKDENGSLIVEVPFGQGRCLICASPGMCANLRITDENSRGNFQLLSNWLSDSPGKIYFDEKCHGYLDSTDFFHWILHGKYGPFFVELFLLSAVAIWSLNQRFGPVRPVFSPRRISNLEFIDGMAHTYRKAHAHDTAWSLLFNSFKTRLCKGLGVSQSETPETLAKIWSEATGIEERSLREFLLKAANCESRYITSEEMLKLVAECDKLAERSKEHLALASSRRLGV